MERFVSWPRQYLINQVSKRCPPETPIPSEPWVRLNFAPRDPRAKVAHHYRGRLQVKRAVQKRLFHPDELYCAAFFRYQRELAVKYCELSTFICIDDKHRIKVGEPGYPVAAVERGCQVIVSQTEEFVVADHDFTRFSIIPSVVLQVNIPEQFEGSWYHGKVMVGRSCVPVVISTTSCNGIAFTAITENRQQNHPVHVLRWRS